MPYISKYVREAIDPHIDPLSENIRTVGDLNYVITRLAMQYLQGVGISYGNIAGVIGTIRLTADELIRRVVNPYEDKKINENGDVAEYESLPRFNIGNDLVKPVTEEV